MNATDVSKALEGQLDELQSLTGWVLTFGFTATALCIQGDDPISVLDLKLSRTEAFYVLSVVYAAIGAAAAARFHRVSSLLKALGPIELKGGFAAMSTHKWLFNPFVVKDPGEEKALVAFRATAGLVITFWLCLLGLFVLLPRKAFGSPLAVLFDQGLFNSGAWTEVGSKIGHTLVAAFPVLPAAFALEMLLRVSEHAAQRVSETEPEFRVELENHHKAVKAGADLGIAVGGGLFAITLVLRFGLSW